MLIRTNTLAFSLIGKDGPHGIIKICFRNMNLVFGSEVALLGFREYLILIRVRSKSGLILVCNVNIVYRNLRSESLRTLKIMPRNFNEIRRSWISAIVHGGYRIGAVILSCLSNMFVILCRNVLFSHLFLTACTSWCAYFWDWLFMSFNKIRLHSGDIPFKSGTVKSFPPGLSQSYCKQF